MSYDIDCYLAKKPWFLPKTQRGDDWQISVHGPIAVEPEDIQPEVLNEIGHRRWLIGIHLEGIVDDNVLTKVETLLSRLIAKNDAIALDLQTNIIWSRTGRREVQISRDSSSKEKIATLSFFFDNNALKEKLQKRRFFELVETMASKGLPRRYGSSEPMPFKLDEHGKDHFLQQWEEDTYLFWRGTSPYQWVLNSLNDDKKQIRNVWDDRPLPFTCSKMEFQLSVKILKTKKELSQLLAFQAECSKFLNVFYSEITLGSPEVSSEWRGLPTKLPLSSVLGAPYIEIWTDFKMGATKLQKSMFIRDSLTMDCPMIAPPQELSQPEEPTENPLNSALPLAEVFPFERPKRAKGKFQA